MWLCLADGRARSTADLKRLATAARVRAKRAGDAAAANTRDRQARDQRRRQRAPHSQHNAFSVGFSSTQIVVSNGTLRGAQRVPRASSKHPGSRQSVLIRARHVL